VSENRILKRVFENRMLKRIFENRTLKRIFENRMLKRICIHGGNNRTEKIRNQELHNLYSSPNIVRVIISRIMMKLEVQVACMEELRNVYKILAGKPAAETWANVGE
jgi:hypothetical protein